jgi:CRISPR system Cascade subunit CasB
MAKKNYLKEAEAEQLKKWWSWLDDNRADRASLRRADNPDDILLTPAFAHFLQKMPPRWAASEPAFPITDAAMVAAVISRVKAPAENSFAKALALPKEGGSKAVMSELRFQQLQKSRTPEDFFRRVCRAVALLNGKANIVDLADSILHWLHEFRTAPSSKPLQRLAVKWATEYYSVYKD